MVAFIAVAAILVLMIGFLFVALRGITRRLGKEAQSNAIRQADLFDDLIVQKEEKLQSVSRQLSSNKSLERSWTRTVQQSQKRPQESIYFQVLQSDFIDQNLFDYYREIKRAFDIDKKACIQSVLEEHEQYADGANSEYSHILSMFSFEQRYSLLTLENSDQLLILREIFSSEQCKLLDDYIEQSGEYSGIGFFDWLEMRAAVNRADIVVFTGSFDDNYTSVDKRIKTVYEPGICEGVQIALGNTLYDFSIQDMEIYI